MSYAAAVPPGIPNAYFDLMKTVLNMMYLGSHSSKSYISIPSYQVHKLKDTTPFLIQPSGSNIREFDDLIKFLLALRSRVPILLSLLSLTILMRICLHSFRVKLKTQKAAPIDNIEKQFIYLV